MAVLDVHGPWGVGPTPEVLNRVTGGKLEIMPDNQGRPHEVPPLISNADRHTRTPAG